MLVGFVNALAEVILSKIEHFTLDISNCREQGNDGAASVSTHISCLSAHTLRINEKVIYFHCHSHQLNLVVTASCSITYVRNVLYQIEEFSFFFIFFWATSKNPRPFHRKPWSRLLEEETEKCLLQMEKNTGLLDFESLYISIVFSIESMSVCNRETSTKASSVYKSISPFDFISTLLLTRSILDLILLVTELL